MSKASFHISITGIHDSLLVEEGSTVAWIIDTAKYVLRKGAEVTLEWRFEGEPPLQVKTYRTESELDAWLKKLTKII